MYTRKFAKVVLLVILSASWLACEDPGEGYDVEQDEELENEARSSIDWKSVNYGKALQSHWSLPAGSVYVYNKYHRAYVPNTQKFYKFGKIRYFLQVKPKARDGWRTSSITIKTTARRKRPYDKNDPDQIWGSLVESYGPTTDLSWSAETTTVGVSISNTGFGANYSESWSYKIQDMSITDYSSSAWSKVKWLHKFQDHAAAATSTFVVEPGVMFSYSPPRADEKGTPLALEQYDVVFRNDSKKRACKQIIYRTLDDNFLDSGSNVTDWYCWNT